MLKNNGIPEEITLDNNPANIIAIDEINKKLVKRGKEPIKIRQNKYLNNRIEQNHRNIKRKTRQIQTFKSFHSAKFTLAGVEIVHSIKKNKRLSGHYCLQNLINEIRELVT